MPTRRGADTPAGGSGRCWGPTCTDGDHVDLIYGRGGGDRLTAPRHGWINGGTGHDHCRAETVPHREA